MCKQLIYWLLANAVLPIILPVLTISIVDWFVNGNFPFGDTFIMLFSNGFYIFSSLSLLLSLIEDYSVFKMIYGPVTGGLMMLLVGLTLLMFYLIQASDSNYVESHVSQFASIWCLAAVYAIYLKVGLLIYKNKNNV